MYMYHPRAGQTEQVRLVLVETLHEGASVQPVAVPSVAQLDTIKAQDLENIYCIAGVIGN